MIDPKTLLRAAVVVVLLSSLSACARVAPYQRGKLALPSMSTSDLIGPGEDHVRAVHEGATGGSFSAGGGCGCN